MMLTTTLLDQWAIDVGLLLELTRAQVGDCDIYLGGSLADDLGDDGSDIDVYCFPADGNLTEHRRVLHTAEGRAIELHVVDAAATLARTDSLVPLVTSRPAPEPAAWPMVSGGTFRLLHALYLHRPLADGHGVAERLRARLGADALPLYTALRSTLGARRLHAVAGADTGVGALYAARQACELALDAALATLGQVNPNPRFRLALARRSGLFRDIPHAEDVVVGALFPDVRDVAAGLAACTAGWDLLMDVVDQDAFLARFWRSGRGH